LELDLKGFRYYKFIYDNNVKYILLTIESCRIVRVLAFRNLLLVLLTLKVSIKIVTDENHRFINNIIVSVINMRSSRFDWFWGSYRSPWFRRNCRQYNLVRDLSLLRLSIERHDGFASRNSSPLLHVAHMYTRFS